MAGFRPFFHCPLRLPVFVPLVPVLRATGAGVACHWRATGAGVE